MICDDCGKAADAIADLGVSSVVVGQQLVTFGPILDDVTVKALNIVLQGHDRCAARQSASGFRWFDPSSCTCQHRRVVSSLTRQVL